MPSGPPWQHGPGNTGICIFHAPCLWLSGHSRPMPVAIWPFTHHACGYLVGELHEVIPVQVSQVLVDILLLLFLLSLRLLFRHGIEVRVLPLGFLRVTRKGWTIQCTVMTSGLLGCYGLLAFTHSGTHTQWNPPHKEGESMHTCTLSDATLSEE